MIDVLQKNGCVLLPFSDSSKLSEGSAVKATFVTHPQWINFGLISESK
jgi:hypothetical protein